LQGTSHDGVRRIGGDKAEFDKFDRRVYCPKPSELAACPIACGPER